MSQGIEPRIADALLDALASDDSFRERFAKDPDAVLAGLGHTGDPIGACCLLPLPDKKTFAEARDALREQLTAKAFFKVFQL